MRRLPGGLAVLALAGCGTNAIIRDDRFEHDVRIMRSTPSDIIVMTNEGERAIPRASVRDIDHPGNVLAVAGLPLVAFGVANLLGAWNCGDGEASHTFCTGSGVGLLVGIGGLAMTIWGLTNHHRSSQAAEVPQPAPTSAHNELQRITIP